MCIGGVSRTCQSNGIRNSTWIKWQWGCEIEDEGFFYNCIVIKQMGDSDSMNIT